MPSLDRRRFLAASAALSGFAMTGFDAVAQAQVPRRGGTLRISVDQAAVRIPIPTGHHSDN